MKTDILRKAVAAIKKERPAYEALLDFYEGLFLAQEKSQEKVQIMPVEMSADLVSMKLKEGFSLATPEAFHIDCDASERLLRKLCLLVPKTNRLLFESGEKLIHAMDRGDIEMKSLFPLVLNGDDGLLKEVIGTVKIDQAPLLFLIYNAIRPSLRVCAEQLASHLKEDPAWQKGTCPVCGSTAALSVLKEEGKRFLVCGFCGHEWATPRLMCPYCETQDQKKLHYFFSKEEKAFRVNVCNGCNRYIKNVDTRELNRPMYPPLEIVSTLHLDMLAKEKGHEGSYFQWLPT